MHPYIFYEMIKAAGVKNVRRVAELYVESAGLNPNAMPEVQEFWVEAIANEIKPYLKPRGRPKSTGSPQVARAAYYAACCYDHMLATGARKYGLLDKVIKQAQERMKAEGRAVPNHESIKNFLKRPESKAVRNLGERLEADETRLLKNPNR